MLICAPWASPATQQQNQQNVSKCGKAGGKVPNSLGAERTDGERRGPTDWRNNVRYFVFANPNCP